VNFRSLRLAARLACVALSVVACRPQVPAGANAPPMVAQEANEAVPAGALTWSTDRPLGWRDFRARPPAGHAEAAVTATGVVWGFHCAGDVFTFQMTATFIPDRSWVDPSVSIQLGGGMGVLRHEQTHFDLTEVYARRMRQSFSTLSRPCDRATDELTQMGDRFVREESSTQIRYDQETANGRAGTAQARWERDVKSWLDGLAAYAGR